MLPFILYTFKSAIGLALFYMLYKLLLSKMSFFKLNRFTILFLVGLAVFLPWISSLLPQSLEVVEGYNQKASVVLQEVIITPMSSNAIEFSFTNLLIGIYLIGVGILLIRLIISTVKLLVFIRKYPNIPQSSGSILILHDKQLSAMSWFNYILISSDDYNQHGEEILLHEEAHCRFKHTIDCLFMECISLWQWFNPAVWWFKRELEVTHEYQADNEVLNQGVNPQIYQLLLIKKTVGVERFQLANSLNNSFLKKRITMMIEKKTNKWSTLRIALMVPAVLVVALLVPNNLYATSIVSEFVNEIKEEIPQTPKKQQTKTEDEVFMVVEKMPEYPGGLQELMKYLASNIKYPAKAQEKGIQGRVAVQFTIGTDGSAYDFEVIRGVDPSLDQEAVRVLTGMSKWIPGEQKGKVVSVRYTVPVTFKLRGEAELEGEVSGPTLIGNVKFDTKGNSEKGEETTPIQGAKSEEVVVVGYGQQK